MIRVLLVDDHTLVRTGLRLLLNAQPGIEVVAEAGTVREAVLEAGVCDPGVIVLDVVMPGESGIEGAPALLKEAPSAKLLMLSMQDDPRYVSEAFANGASGYVLKEAADTELVAAVRAVAADAHYINPELGARFIATEAREQQQDENALSKREAEVVRLLALGHTNREISHLLYLSTRTVEAHRAHSMEKLHLRSRAQLVRYAIDHHLVGDDSTRNA